MTVVAAGAKAILDIPKTLEVLETQGVPVIAYGQDDIPAFWSVKAGSKPPCAWTRPRKSQPAHSLRGQMGIPGGQLIANPIPQDAEIAAESWPRSLRGRRAMRSAHGITGKGVTPYLLQRIFELTEGRSLTANIALGAQQCPLGR